MIYEILNEAGEVINTIIAEQDFVDKKHPGRYRLVGPEPVPYVTPIVTKTAFRFRLTDAEYIAILSEAKIDIEVQAWVETFNMVTQINLDDPRTATGLEMMVTKDLLTKERKTEILTAPVESEERP